MQNIKRRMIPLALSAIMALSSQVYAKTTPIDIVAQPLASALTQFAEQAHVQVLVSQELVNGKVAPEVRGELEPIDALKALLKNSGLEAVSQNGTLIIKKVEKAQEESLEKITMTGEVKPEEGSAGAGYKVDTVKNVGPWGEKKLLDTPYSINIASSDLVENTVSNSTDQLFRMNSGIQLLQPYDMNGLTRVMMRGFLIQTSMIDSILGNNAGQGIFLENIDRIEMMTGLSGFMYGVGNIGGTLNYVTKHPTETPLYSMTVGNYGGSQYYAHTDISDKIDQEGKVKYRINLMKQDGDTIIDDQSIDRWMTSGALDWHVTDNLLIGVDAMYGHYRADGRPGQWGMLNTSLSLPSAPDTNALWASPDTFNQNDTTRLGTRLVYDINDIFALRMGYGYQKDERETIFSSLTITSPTAYRLNKAFVRANDTETNSAYAYLDSTFETLGIKHKMTFGMNGYISDGYAGYESSGSLPSMVGSVINNLSLADASSANVSLPSYNFDSLNMLKTDSTKSKNILIGDTIEMNDQWSTLLEINHANYITKSFNPLTGDTTSYYGKSKSTPSLSLIYKPLSNITIYTTYIESLQQGSIVKNSGTTIYTNDGEVFEPVVSEQYEVGVKSELGNTLLTMALFQIDKANAYTQYNSDGTYTMFQNGKQTHKGIETTLSGKVTDNLTLLGGVTLMDAEVKKSTNNLGVGKIPQGVAEEMAKLYAEYDLPFIPRLTVTGGLYYVGKSYLDVNNLQEVPSYTIADMGLRYTTKIYGNDTIFRLNVTNITDKAYWMSNYTIGTMLGSPRMVELSATMKF